MFKTKRINSIISVFMILVMLLCNSGIYCFAESINNESETNVLENEEITSNDILNETVNDDLVEESILTENDDDTTDNVTQDSTDEPIIEDSIEILENETDPALSNEEENSAIDELYTLFEKYNLSLENADIDFLTSLDYEETDGHLLATMDGSRYLVDELFIDTYAKKRNGNGLFLGGTPGVTQTITLSFGDGYPTVDKSNWSNTSWAKLNPVHHTIQITGACGELIVDSLKKEGITDDLILNYGEGDHVLLPDFKDYEWSGFTFAGWEDENGNNLFNTQKGTFDYVFQYSGDVTYKAIWNVDTTPTYDLNVKYARNGIDLASNYQATKNHRSAIYLEAAQVPGYKIDNVKVYFDTLSSPIGIEGLKSLGGNNSFIDYNSEDLSLSADNLLSGCMPNHNLDITYNYIPDTSQKFNVTINYYYKFGAIIKDPDIISLSAEELIDITPTNIDNYAYVRTVVDKTTSNLKNGLYQLGSLHVDNEAYTSDAVNNNNGHVYALMPNQDVSINYYYELSGSDVTLYIQKELQQKDGSYLISTVSEVVSIGSANHHTATIPNLENQGYGAPVVSMENVTNVSYNYISAMDGSDGSLEYYLETTDTPIIYLKYSYNYSSEYWTKLEIISKPDGHGSVVASVGSAALDNRYIPRNKDYTLAELLEDTTVTTEDNYICKWYKSNITGTDKTGEELPTTGIHVDGNVFSLFASFEEDPDKWIDILFSNNANCTIAGTLSYHILKNTPITSIVFPTVTPNTGYVFNNAWLDSDGNVLAGTFTASKTYTPHVIVDFTGSATPVKPVAHITYDVNGLGTANIFGVYNNRKYVLTDRNEKVLSIKTSSEVRSGFDNLTPGTVYHLYEVLDTTAVAIGSTINPSNAGVSDGYEFGIKAYKEKPVVSANSNGTYKITITPKANILYALLDDRYSIVTNWTTNATFDNLVKGSYYLLVAKSSSDTSLAANNESAIKNGVAIYTSTNDLTGKNNHLIIYGNATAQGVGVPTISGGVRIYTVASGTSVTIQGANGNKTIALSNNVTINKPSSMINTFTMPNEDVVINNVSLNDTIKNTSNKEISNIISVYNADEKVSLFNLDSVRNTLNSDPVLTEAINKGCDIHHYIVISSYATNKSKVSSLGANNGVVAPYEYTIDIQTIVSGMPYVSSHKNDTDLDLSGVMVFDNSIIGNADYKIDNTDVVCPYVDDEHYMGAGNIDLSLANPRPLQYTKQHYVRITCDTEGINYDLTMYVPDRNKLTASSGYNSLNNDRLKNIFDNPASEADAKEYIYDSITYTTNEAFNINDTIINGPKELKLNYHINAERETAKTNLSDAITRANQKLYTLFNENVKNTLRSVITSASSYRSSHKNYTVQNLVNKTNELNAAIDAAVDPITSGDTVMINLVSTDGGEITPNIIEVNVGDDYNYNILENVRAVKNNYEFVMWNTQSDGSGTKISPTDSVGLTPSNTLYAIWRKAGDGGASGSGSGSSSSRISGSSVGFAGGSGGGGGRGANNSNLLYRDGAVNLANSTINNNLMLTFYFENTKNNMVKINENELWGVYSIYDIKNNSISTMIGEKSKQQGYKNAWIELTCIDGNKRIYKTDEKGNVYTGKYLDTDGKMYYFNEQAVNYAHGELKTGWIPDSLNARWYYADTTTGQIVTGIKQINGKSFYFYTPSANSKSNDKLYKQEYGLMLANVTTYDGYTINSNGEITNYVSVD